MACPFSASAVHDTWLELRNEETRCTRAQSVPLIDIERSRRTSLFSGLKTTDGRRVGDGVAVEVLLVSKRRARADVRFPPSQPVIRTSSSAGNDGDLDRMDLRIMGPPAKECQVSDDGDE